MNDGDASPHEPGGLREPTESATQKPTDVNLTRAWTGIAAHVWRRNAGWLERKTGRVLRSPGLARALLTAPSLLLPWLLASAAVVAAGALATLSTGQPMVWLVTPALAAVGIAYAYGPGIDPAWELSCSMAVSERTVLLVRALAVFAVNAILGLAASAVSGAAAAITIGWLLPMTATCGLALATATLARSASLGAAAGATAWAITVLSARVASGRLTAAITNTALAVPYIAVALGCALVAVYATRVPKPTS